MNIIYFVQQLYNKGGLERTLTDKAAYLVARGHRVMFVTFEHKGAFAYPLPQGVEHADVDCHVYTLYSQPAYKRIGGFMRLKRKFRSRLAAVLQSFRPSVIVVTIPYTENFISDLAAVARGVPFVVECHLAYGTHYQAGGLLERFMWRFYDPMKAMRRADSFITLTQGDARSWQHLGMRNVRVLPNPLPIEATAVAAASAADKLPGRIICVGRLDEQKRFDRLVDAFALAAPHCPGWWVDIFGEGKLRGSLQEQIDGLGLHDRVRLMGTTAQVADEYRRSQFLVLSSDYEGFGLVIIEAMACGLPVVSVDCPFGPSEIIQDQVTGLLAQMDAHDLAQKMGWMMTHDAERRLMGQEARATADRYKKEVVMPLWEQAYLDVAGK